MAVPLPGMAASWLASRLVWLPAFQAWGMRSELPRPGTVSNSMPGASTMRSALSTWPDARVTFTPTGSMAVTSPSTTFTP